MAYVCYINFHDFDYAIRNAVMLWDFHARPYRVDDLNYNYLYNMQEPL